MSTVGACEARTHLPNLLERVAKGMRITITRHGVPVAVLSPVHPVNTESVRDTIEELVKFRLGRMMPSSELREMIAEGRHRKQD